MKKEEDRSWAQVRGSEERQEGQEEARIWGEDLPGSTLPRPSHAVLAQASLLISQSSCLICKMGTVIIYTSQGLHKDQKGEKGI